MDLWNIFNVTAVLKLFRLEKFPKIIIFSDRWTCMYVNRNKYFLDFYIHIIQNLAMLLQSNKCNDKWIMYTQWQKNLEFLISLQLYRPVDQIHFSGK